MKLIAHSPIAAVLAAVFLATTAARGEDEKDAKTPVITLPADVKGELEKAGLDAKTIEQIQGAISGASGTSVRTITIGPDGEDNAKSEETQAPTDGASKPAARKKGENQPEVSVITTVVGPDGTITTQNGGKPMTLDLGKVIAEATAATSSASSDSKANGETATSISGTVMVVGSDGKVTTQALGDVADSEALQKALSAALGGIDVKVLQAGDAKVQTQVFGFGAPVIEGSELAARLTEIEKELKGQRDLLEQILSKL